MGGQLAALKLEGRTDRRGQIVLLEELLATLKAEATGEGGYGPEGWARRFFEHWRAALKWQRLRPYEKFAAMIDRHWDGITAYCRPENKVVALGFVKILTYMLPVL